MRHYPLVRAECLGCGKEHSIESVISTCDCGNPVDIRYDYNFSLGRALRGPITHWKYECFFPVKKGLSLCEGGTPFLKSSYFGPRLSTELFFKLEGLNPSGSFKDRGSAVEITNAKNLGYKKVLLASTGNMGASVSAYSALAGLECKVLVPKGTKKAKLSQMKIYGANVQVVRGDYNSALARAEEIFRSDPSYYLAGDYCFRAEGQKSVGFEIFEQLGWESPDYIVCPVGNGTLFFAIYKAARELRNLGLIKKLPKMVCVQASGAAAITRAWETKRPVQKVPVNTKVSAIAVGKPIYSKQVLEIIRDSKGFATKASDKGIIDAKSLLARREAILVESAGAAGLCAMLKNKSSFRGKRVVCVATGNGFKDMILS